MWCAVHWSIALLEWHCLLINVVCSTAIVWCATVALCAEWCRVQYSENLMWYNETVCTIMWCSVQRYISVMLWNCLLNKLVCNSPIVYCASVALSSEKCGVLLRDKLLLYSGTVCWQMWCAEQRLVAVLLCQSVLNNLVCNTAIDYCARVALSAEYCGVQYSDIFLC